MNYDYPYGYKHSYETSDQYIPEYNTNMMYYYDDGSGAQMYTVDETLLKEYIKRQMYVTFC